MDDVSVLYKNIRNRRKALNMSQQELGELVGYSGKSMISQVEKGIIDLPTTMIKKFAEALQTTPAALMGWEEEKEVSLEEQIMYADLEHDTSHLENIKYTADQLEKAFELFEKYRSADNDIKTVVDTLLKRPQQES